MTPAGFAARMASFGPAPARVAVAVSGGPHSLALAWLVRSWAGSGLLGLVVDHGLRPESASEAEATRAALERLGIPARVLPLGMAPGPAMQERARHARLAALLAACSAGGAAEGANWLLLGHHRMDQAETVLMRAARGSGPSGLAGMPAIRATPEALILRPLLDVAPAALERICAAAGLTPVRDPSNADPAFARIRARHALDDPGGEGPRVAALVAAAEAFGHRRVTAEAAMHTRLAGLELFPDGTARVPPATLGHDDCAERLLALLLRAIGGAAHAPAAAQVRRLLQAGHGTLGGAWWRRDGWLLREPALVAPPIEATAGARWDGRFHLSHARPGCLLGAVGGGSARRAALPALWCEGTMICAGPSESLTFRPIGGPVDAVFRPMPQLGHSPGANVTYVR